MSDEEPSDDEESREHSDEDDIALGSPTDPEQRAARREAMNTLVPGIDPSDYGKMPAAYYSNSQRVTRTTLGTEMREDLPDNTANADRQPETRNTIRPPLLPRDEYDGADSDDETDEEDVDDDEDQPPYEWRRLEALINDNITALLDSQDSPPDADAASAASSGDGDDDGSEALLLQKLRVPDVPLPAIVWRDIRGEHEDDPMEYLRELDR